MKSLRRGLREYFCRKVFAYLLVCCLILNTSLPVALALGPGDVTGVTGPTGGAVLPAGPDPWVDPTIVTENGAIIDWSNFNTAGGETVTFEQYDVLGGSLSDTSAVLNRISSGLVPTQFNGNLIANGRVFVVNPAGIVFGRGSTVNVTQLVASGLNLTNFEDVLTGGDMEFGGGSGEVTNHASINADSVHLVGKKVMNANDISTPDYSGVVVLAAGDSVYIAQDGSNVVVGPVAGPGNGLPDVLNVGKIKSLRGTVVLAAGDTWSRAVVNNAWITVGPGTLRAHAARVENGGTMLANGSILGDGGSITLS